jgi:hypothetical protein
MICPLYDSLSPLERVEMVGKICHAMQSDNSTFLQVAAIISLAERKGVFDNVVINPPETNISNEA